MKKFLLIAGFCLWALGQSFPAEAAYVTGEDLLKNCQSEKSEALFSCLNYIAGVIDYHVMMQSLGTAPTTDFCLPETLSITDAAIAVTEYLQKNPQNGSFIAAPAVVMALHASFPCATPGAAHKKKKKHG